MGCGANRGQTKETTTPEKQTNGGGSNDLLVRQSAFVRAKMSNVKEDYVIKKNIGEGTYGQVLKVEHQKSKQERAMKRITIQSLDEQESKRIEQEIVILKDLDHPYILKIYESYMDEQHYYIITEFVKGGELFSEIEKRVYFTEDEARRLFKELLIVINYAHQNGIMHRDLKPENILLDEDPSKDSKFNIKVIDWGAAVRFAQGDTIKELIGTPFYIAPEVLKKNYNEKCDIWSLGVILYILLCGEPPFYGDTDKEIFKVIADTGYKHSYQGNMWGQVSSEGQDILDKMLTRDYSKRPSANDLLQHKWFEKLASQEPENQEVRKTEAMGRLKVFQTKTSLQKAVLTYIAGHLSTKSDVQYLKQLFIQLDKDGNGTLSKEQLIEGFKDIQGEEGAASYVEDVLRNVDADKNNFINYTEFLTATLKHEDLVKEDKLNAAFKMFDVDGNGKISKEEISFVLGNQYAKHPDEWNSIIDKYDENGDKELNFQEFKQMMSSMTQQEK